ncbi:MAG: hypothetical protein KatS3mg035_0074 [Bacteroidia bacterium]|nr:MAG: hypothetical protein KatS3mg035_0074 [Bacteroidia bacterium]
MSKFDEAIEAYKAELTELKIDVNEELLREITKGLGPSIYLKDASLVSCSDQSELDRVKKNFLIGKLGISDEESMDSALKAVCEQYKANHRKRAVFYYLLVINLKKESLFI